VRSDLNGRWRRVRAQASVSVADTSSWVRTKGVCDVDQSLALEDPPPETVGSELRLQTLPRNQRRSPEIAHPVGESNVEVDGVSRA
jgi:hypothetical protein